MIRLRMINKLSHPLLSISLIAFFLFQGWVAVVYSEGVSISFSNLSISGVQLSTQSWGNTGGTQTNTTTTVPSTSGTPSSTQDSTANTTPLFNSFINTLLQGSTTVSSPTSSPASTIPSTSNPLQKPASLSNILQTPEPTEELIRPVTFNPLSEDEPLLPMAEPYPVTVCLSYNDIAVSGCPDKKTSSQASEKLAAMILNKYLKGIEIRPFRVVMTSSVSSAQQIQLLCKIETEAIVIIEARMMEALKKSKMFLSETEEGRQQKQNIIIEDSKRARLEAANGINWSHNLRNDRSIHDFHTGKAFTKLNNILISGR
jgi:hypothetical protein